MKFYLIGEEHNAYRENREQVVPELYNKGVIVGAEGHHYPIFMDYIIGLEDVLYGIFSEIGALYLSACEKNEKEIQTAIENLTLYYNIRQREDLPFDITISLNNQELNIKTKVMKAIKSLIDKCNGKKPEECAKIALQQLPFFIDILLKYSQTALYIGKTLDNFQGYYPTLNIENYKKFPEIDKNLQVEFGSRVMCELRNISLVYHVGILLKKAYNEKKDIAIIIGLDHLKQKNFILPIMQRAIKNNFDFRIHDGYKNIMNDLNNELINEEKDERIKILEEENVNLQNNLNLVKKPIKKIPSIEDFSNYINPVYTNIPEIKNNKEDNNLGNEVKKYNNTSMKKN
jgi:hypothetical protein